MQAISQHREKSSIPLGQRRGVSDLARFALDLTWASKRAESETAARSRAYPSPPMSGSPPLPPKANQEAGDRSQAQASYQTTSQQDVYRGASTATTPADIRGQQSAPPPSVRSYPPEPPDRMTYYPRPEDPMHRPVPYPPQGSAVLPQQSYMSLPGAGSSSLTAFPVTSRPPAQENPPYTSPKSQRKTKGHVASACVPCKRAHLR
jgi:hypothetical protein